MGKLNHFDQDGQAHMVDVGEKAETHRAATAEGRIRMQPATLQLIVSGRRKKAMCWELPGLPVFRVPNVRRT